MDDGRTVILILLETTSKYIELLKNDKSMKNQYQIQIQNITHPNFL